MDPLTSTASGSALQIFGSWARACLRRCVVTEQEERRLERAHLLEAQEKMRSARRRIQRQHVQAVREGRGDR